MKIRFPLSHYIYGLSFFRRGFRVLLLAAVVTAPVSARIEQQAYVKASNTDPGDAFGTSVALAGDIMVIGAPTEDSAASGTNGNQNHNGLVAAGAAYVFVRTSGGAWTQQAYLKASDPQPGALFGYSVAVSGSRIAVGAPSAQSEAGVVYIFARLGGSQWQQEARVTASNADGGDNFGHAVALSGTALLVGAPGEASGSAGAGANPFHNGAPKAGAAYVFTRTGNQQWTQQAYLKPSNTQAGVRFGWSVALDGATAVVGAINERSLASGVNGDEENWGGSSVGAAYVFGRVASAWTQTAYLKAVQPASGDKMGSSVAVSGPVIACGSVGHSVSLFVNGATGWTPDLSFPATLPGAEATGRTVALSGDTLLIGMPYDCSGRSGVSVSPPPGIRTNSGAAYLYRRTAGGWERRAFFKASNAGAEDFFGNSVALSGDTGVIGAFGEDSLAKGINGNQVDNTVENSGAAYVFHVSGPLVEITAAARHGDTYTMDFFGPPGLTGWKVMGSTDLTNFTIDKTSASTLTELSAGQYRAVTDLTGSGPDFFLLVEHE